MNRQTALLLGLVVIGLGLWSVSGSTKTVTSQSSLVSPTDMSMKASNAGSVPMARLVATFSAFAGSSANAESLVEGLRTGTAITLVDATNATTTFTPATHAMGWGNVKIALALAQAELSNAGITSPTPADIEAALNGGVVNNGTMSTTFTGVLAQRASGLGWGAIARADGLNLGKVVSAVSKPAGVGNGHTAVSTAFRSNKGVVSASGNTSFTNSHHARTSTGIVTAGGESLDSASAARVHTSRGIMIAGNNHAATSGVTTAPRPDRDAVRTTPTPKLIRVVTSG